MQYINDNTIFLRDSFEKIMQIDQMFLNYKNSDPRTFIESVRAKAQELDIPFVLKEVPLAIDQTLDGISRITRIVQSMKQFSQPGTQNKELYDINKIIDDVTTISRNEWKYVADLETDFDPDLPQVFCFPNSLSQVFLNLIVNAAQSIEEKLGENSKTKGKISISTRCDKTNIIITLTDTGKGIPDQIRQKIFDPFFTTKDVGKGTGQGLAISHSIVVDMHGGSISAESIPGNGATFIIIIPAETSRKEEDDEM